MMAYIEGQIRCDLCRTTNITHAYCTDCQADIDVARANERGTVTTLERQLREARAEVRDLHIQLRDAEQRHGQKSTNGDNS